jgi:hypothetical protein
LASFSEAGLKELIVQGYTNYYGRSGTIYQDNLATSREYSTNQKSLEYSSIVGTQEFVDTYTGSKNKQEAL